MDMTLTVRVSMDAGLEASDVLHALADVVDEADRTVVTFEVDGRTLTADVEVV